MRHLAHVALAVVLMPALGLALDTSHRAPTKPLSLTAPNTPSPIRQGGDTMADAIAIAAIPFTTTGTTTGFNDDYDEACPYDDSTAPDVVYRFVPADDVTVDIDMLGSSYDTKIYVYDAELELVACNDDFYPDYVSRLRFVALLGGAQYYLVIDGYGEEHGDYVLSIEGDELCELEIPPGAVFEGEPPLVDDYLDAHNGGCNSPEFGVPWQDLYGDADGELVFHGVSGWYVADGSPHRDTDWFFLHLGETGVVELEATAEFATYFWHMPPNCELGLFDNILVEECDSGVLTIEGPPGTVTGFWAGPTVFEPPGVAIDNEYDYIVRFTGLMPQPIATEATSWTTIKRLFR